MNGKTDERQKDWSRNATGRTGPVRNAGGFYRTAEGKDRGDGRVLGGIPLNSANDAVVAAVQLAYKVADAQVARSLRLAQRLRKAGDDAVGPHSDRKALDAAEQLVMKTLMSGLAWWEGSVAEGRCPVKRIAAAEYQMLGSLLGLGPTPAARTRESRASEERPPRSERGKPADGDIRQKAPAGPHLQIVHKGERRAVRVKWELTDGGVIDNNLQFYGPGNNKSDVPDGKLALKGKTATLTLILTADTAAGVWKAAICNPLGLQLGFIEIEL